MSRFRLDFMVVPRRLSFTQFLGVRFTRPHGNPREWALFISRFETLVHDVVRDDAQRLAILADWVRPNVRKRIVTLLTSPQRYEATLKYLQRQYGEPGRIHDLLQLPTCKQGDGQALQNFSDLPVKPASRKFLSADDKEALRKLKETIRHDGERYELGFPWKEKTDRLPNNRDAALRRLHSMERRFRGDAAFAARYAAVMDCHLQAGHAVPAKDAPLGSRIW